MSTTLPKDSSLSPRSIYAAARPGALPTRRARGERRRRAKERVRGDLAGRPPIDLERAAPMQAILQRNRLLGPDAGPLERLVTEVSEEVKGLEAWAAKRPRQERESGPTIRRALELLRGFGRMSALDFSSIPEEGRPLLVTWLALEHRWCYAAAGTDRAAFKRATGRTGAR
jgi:hypothetical protein